MQIDSRYSKLGKIAPKHAGRYEMRHARLEGDKLVVTDGRRLVAVPIERGEHDVDGFVSTEALAAAFKAKHRGSPEITANGSLAVLGGPTFDRPTEGEFPRWQPIAAQRLEPGTPDTVNVTFNADLLHGIAAAIATGGGIDGAVTLTFKVEACYGGGQINADGPITVTRASGANGELAILMPIRADDGALAPAKAMPKRLPETKEQRRARAEARNAAEGTPAR